MKLELFLILAIIIFYAGCTDGENTDKTDEDIISADEDSSGDTGNTDDSGDSGDTADSCDTGNSGDSGNSGNPDDSGDTGEDIDTAKTDEDASQNDPDTELPDDTAEDTDVTVHDNELPDIYDADDIYDGDDISDETGTGDDDTVFDPCSAEPCSGIENSDGICTTDGTDFICGCTGGYHFNSVLSQCLQTFSISWCNTQFPVDLTGESSVIKGDAVTFYTQFYINSITQGTVIANSTHTSSPDYPQIILQFATGSSGTDAFTWSEWIEGAVPNEDKGNNDEYMFPDIVLDNDAGSYDFLIRISGDSGSTWTYCNANRLDSLGYNGTDASNTYNASKNGHLTVVNP